MAVNKFEEVDSKITTALGVDEGITTVLVARTALIKVGVRVEFFMGLFKTESKSLSNNCLPQTTPHIKKNQSKQ